MRIVSLVPHATELLFALGLGDQVVGVTHECDHPAEARERRHVTADRLPAGLGSAEIDAAVREYTEGGEAIYALDETALRELAPDLIVTQALCPVCAVSYDDVAAVAQRLDPAPKVIALDPKTYGETIADVRTVATAADATVAGVDLIARTARRVDEVERAIANVRRRPRVVALEWFDPVFVAGHWTPQLIEMAGGFDVLGFSGEHSEQVTWETVAAAERDVVIAMPCGYDAHRAHEEALLYADRLREVGAGQVVAVDASATFSRPGPRLVDGLELLAHVLHPDLVPPGPGPALTVDLPS
ncbi:MAG: Vitamin B12 ABC transporter, substrate-binding protein BtuF [uncultured Solirubrobacteraceae bacterium]|uniref:Vitamin B12 ABC transporter, substrate-binding protein BtuF n=1 Tax=uncultured Solirubrobacteraceae bacterium TaxID=1162706 RepID=A0A6J4T2T4_9ACTN|nr:MAG: Vitamin B12 ABC transporter, substrate-binding protein BtuF [uncultured Solirubrobacteraceae bacterium]